MSQGKKGALARSRSIDQQIDEDRQRRHNEIPLLILGGASSGKSTFIKQLRLHKGDGFPEKERRKLCIHVYENLADALNILLDNMKHLGLDFDSDQHKRKAEELQRNFPKCNHYYITSRLNRQCQQNSDQAPSAASCASNTSNYSLNSPDITTIPISPAHSLNKTDYSTLKNSFSDVLEVYRDAGVQKCLEQRDEFVSRLVPAEEYFLENVERISENDYIPTILDVLYIRKPTIGVVEHLFNVNGLSYRVVDVAGQKSQRKKWIHFFEGVTAVVFFVALSGFCESLEEDCSLNSLADSLHTFGEVVDNSFLESTDFILFLNKKDIFEKRLKSHSIKQCFQNYSGEETPEQCISYIKEEFLKKKPDKKQMYVHVSCAVDVDTMKSLTSTVLQVIIEINLRKAATPL